MARNFNPVVLQDHNRRPLIVFAKGRTLYHAVAVEHDGITLVKLDTLRGLTPVAKGVHAPDDPYPVKRAASFYLNKTWRPCTKRAKAVLKGLVARKPKFNPEEVA